MRRLLKTIFWGVVFLAVAWWVSGLRGAVSIDAGPYNVEATVPVAITAVLVLFGLLYLLFRLVVWIIGMTRFHSVWRSGRRRRAGERAVTRALVALAAGEKADARLHASRARAYLGDTPQTLLLSAEAGRLAGRDDEATTALTALAARKDAAFLGLRGLLAGAIARRDWSEAATIARRAEEAHPGAAWLRQERAQLAIRAERWAEALTLSPPDAPRAALAVAAAQAESNPAQAEKLARQALKHDPAFVPGILAYATQLRTRGRERKALAVLTDGWARTPHPDIGALALAPVSEKLARLAAAERLTASTLNDPESRLLLARCALDAGRTEEARRHLEALRSDGFNQRRMWLLLAELEEEARGDTEEGRLAQHDALRHAAVAEADPGWRCTSCHTPQPAWRAACPICQTPGSLRWGSGTVSDGAGTAMVERVG
jgi:HemY protein